VSRPAGRSGPADPVVDRKDPSVEADQHAFFHLRQRASKANSDCRNGPSTTSSTRSAPGGLGRGRLSPDASTSPSPACRSPHAVGPRPIRAPAVPPPSVANTSVRQGVQQEDLPLETVPKATISNDSAWCFSRPARPGLQLSSQLGETAASRSRSVTDARFSRISCSSRPP
jgi:hypothetical protein